MLPAKRVSMAASYKKSVCDVILQRLYGFPKSSTHNKHQLENEQEHMDLIKLQWKH